MHNAKYCTNRTVCKVCNDKHPTTLHGLVLRKDKSENQDVLGNHKDLTCLSVNMGSVVKSMSVVPFKLIHKYSNKVIITHAPLDN